jgi:hypothetical protein
MGIDPSEWGVWNMKRRQFLEIALASSITTPNAMFGEEGVEISQRTNMANLKGFAIQDPSNKQNVKGFVFIPTVCGEQLQNPDFQYQTGIFDNYHRTSSQAANIGLVRSINKYSGITAIPDKQIYLSSINLISYPFIYIFTEKAFELTETEKQNLEHYLLHGGFVLLESFEPKLDYSQAEASLKQMMRETIKTDSRFIPIPNSHSLYHCFFDFDDGPPQGLELDYFKLSFTPGNSGIDLNGASFSRSRPYLEGIFLDDRLVAVYSGKGYGKKWKSMSNNEPQQKMGVNMVVFALTQAGGIARQKMDSFSSVR